MSVATLQTWLLKHAVQIECGADQREMSEGLGGKLPSALAPAVRSALHKAQDDSHSPATRFKTANLA